MGEVYEPLPEVTLKTSSLSLGQFSMSVLEDRKNKPRPHNHREVKAMILNGGGVFIMESYGLLLAPGQLALKAGS